jgi:hypothetical protein
VIFKAAFALGSVLCASCAQLVAYPDALVDARTGRSLFTRVPATVGGVIGFTVGVPVDLVALPVTTAVHLAQDPLQRDVLSTFLFPSFVLWHIGTLIGAPIDLVEWGAFRAFRSPESLTAAEMEHCELELDQTDFSLFPVTPVYPRPTGS